MPFKIELLQPFFAHAISPSELLKQKSETVMATLAYTLIRLQHVVGINDYVDNVNSSIGRLCCDCKTLNYKITLAATSSFVPAVRYWLLRVAVSLISYCQNVKIFSENN